MLVEVLVEAEVVAEVLVEAEVEVVVLWAAALLVLVVGEVRVVVLLAVVQLSSIKCKSEMGICKIGVGLVLVFGVGPEGTAFACRRNASA